jgi:hypothetical protein
MNFMLRAKDTGEFNLSRVFARVLVAVGGAFWAFALLGAQNMAYGALYSLPELAQGLMLATVPLLITIVVFAIGLFYERLAGVLLLAIALAMVGWGIVAHWGEILLWITAFSTLVAPSGFAGVLYLLAARTQEVQVLTAKTAAVQD